MSPAPISNVGIAGRVSFQTSEVEGIFVKWQLSGFSPTTHSLSLAHTDNFCILLLKIHIHVYKYCILAAALPQHLLFPWENGDLVMEQLPGPLGLVNLAVVYGTTRQHILTAAALSSEHLPDWTLPWRDGLLRAHLPLLPTWSLLGGSLWQLSCLKMQGRAGPGSVLENPLLEFTPVCL